MTETRSPDITLDGLLEELAHEGQFDMIVLSDTEGLPFASSGTFSHHNEFTSEEALAALSSLIMVFKRRVESELSDSRTDEVSVVMNDKSRLVCRYFNIDSDEFILTFIVQPYQTYRRVSNMAITRIRHFYRGG